MGHAGPTHAIAVRHGQALVRPLERATGEGPRNGHPRPEDAGADLITIHGRTKVQGYAGQSDWNRIAQVKQSVSIPVLANGDIHTAPLAIQALKQTGCDGVLIARGALGNPWIFSQIDDLLHGRPAQPVDVQLRINTIKQHFAFHLQQYGLRGITTFRKHITWYLRGMEGAKPYKERLHTAVSEQEIIFILNEILEQGLQRDTISNRDANHPNATARVSMKK